MPRKDSPKRSKKRLREKFAWTDDSIPFLELNGEPLDSLQLKKL